MYLDREYRPRRRRRGIFGRFWPLLLLVVAAVILIQTRPGWLAQRSSMPTPTPTPNIVAFLATAQSALARGDYAAALTAYADIVRLEPNNSDHRVVQSQLHMIEQNIAQAYATAADAVAIAPRNADALTALARAEDWLGEYESALNHALDANEIDPNNVEALAVLAEIYADVGNYEVAQNYIDEALALEPQHVLTMRNQAYLLEKRGKYEEAIAALDQALALDPQRSDLFMEKARIYRVGLADFEKALQAYRAAVEANKTPVTLDALGEGLYNAGDHLQAVRVLRSAVEMDPNYGPALVHLGMALYTRRNYEDAATDLEKGLAIIGDQAREEHLYTAGLAHIYKEPRECARAEPWLRQALVKNPESGPALAGLRICSGEAEPTAAP